MKNELELIEKAKQGDKEALTELVKKYQDTVYNFAFKMCRNKDKAENTMQDTFYNMIKSLNQFDGKSKFSTWLYKIVANNCFMQHRIEKKYEVEDFAEQEEIYDNINSLDIQMIPDLNVENKELQLILDEAIKKLPKEYRIVFVLRDIQGLSVEETAEITKLSIPNVKTRLHRARKFLKKELTKALELEK
jgi:RNA polymerase sigma-70 factor (ECF subfamily)